MKQSTSHQEYKSTLNYLYKQLPMFQRIGPAAFKKDLTNTIALCEEIGQPQETFPSIHIAGTNGKGSTTHLLAAVLQASGRKVGVYTSPHYKDFRERIKINGQLISKKYIVEFVATHKAIIEQIQPSFFEITVAIAFAYFAEQKVDIAIIETGLGGRLDSTNIIQPILSIITNIGYDHQQFLGDTLKEIAFEKAGIIKPNTPVIIGETHIETTEVFLTQAEKQQAPIIFADQHIKVKRTQEMDFHIICDVTADNPAWHLPPSFTVNVKGEYQTKNIATTLQAIAYIREQQLLTGITDKAIEEGLANLKELTYFIGRWQQLGTAPTVLCDSAHNVDGLGIVLAQLKEMEWQQLHFVFGMVNDKDPGNVLAILPKTAQYYFAKADIPRGLDVNRLKTEAEKYGLIGKKYSSVKAALKAAKRKANKEDLIFIGGSIFVVAEIL